MSDILVEVAEVVPVEVNLPEKDNAIEMEVYYQDEVSLDTDLSLFYIKSGEKEIENYVENVSKPEINDYIETYAKPIVTEVVDNIATPVVGEYIEGTVKPEISRFAAEEMSSYAEVATTQAGIATAAAVEASTTAQAVDTKVAEFSEQTEASKQEFIAFAGEKTEEFEQTAQQATADSLANVEHARIWAEGEQAEVKPLGGELSSMGAADLAYALANAPEDTPIDTANMFAMNIFKGEKGDKGDKGDAGKDGKIGIESFATNCITEIPQDIKLELNNGTLTLKAGSKVYVPNGFEVDGVTPKFDKVVIENDLYLKQKYTDNDMFMFVYTNPEGIKTLGSVYKGSTYETRPTAVGDYKLHYIKSENKLFWDVPNYVTTENSFPIAIVDRSADVGFTSIDQVFNGFGYIGSTVFALPNVKGLIPNGRNADGSLRNIEYVVKSVSTKNISGNVDVVLAIYTPQGLPTATSFSNYYYDDEANYNYFNSSKTSQFMILGSAGLSNNTITSFTPKNAFHAVDRNDSSWIAQQAMPSDKYIDLTLGATGSTYTAPANGWVIFRRTSNASGQFLQLVNENSGKLQQFIYSSATNQILGASIPVKKGDLVVVGYSVASTTNQIFRFVYAEGE